MIDIRVWEAEVTQRFLTDPTFHARVQLAVEATAASMRRATGMSMSQDFAAAVVQACAYGAASMEVDVANNLTPELIILMRARADQLGFQLIEKHEE